MIKLILYLTAAVLPVAVFFATDGAEPSSTGSLLNEISKAVIGAEVLYLIVPVYKYWNLIKAYAYMVWHRQLNQDIRLSYSYLFRITLKDENGLSQYLLVANSKRDNPEFQPPGGVYKVFDPADLLRQNVRDAKHFHEPKDVRIKFKGWRLGLILNYLATSNNIELDHGREFYEELTEPGYLSGQDFPYLHLQKVRQVNTGMRYSEWLKCHEYNLHDIIELKLSPDQVKAVETLYQHNGYGKKFIFATESLINTRGMDPSKNRDTFKITEHTCHIL